MDDFQKQAFVFLNKALLVVSILVIGYLIVRILICVVRSLLNKTKLDHTATNFIISIARVILYFIVVMTALGTIGVNIASFITALGAAALTAGLALQDCLSNVVSGLVILINKPFVAGDILEFEQIKGKVETIRIFSTTLHTLDNKLVTIPNSRLTKENVVNCTMVDNRRLDLKYTVSYNDDITLVKEVIGRVVADNANILTQPAPQICVGEHLDNGIQIIVFVWVNPENYYDAYYYMQEEVKLAFDRNNITIPYPHLVVKSDK